MSKLSLAIKTAFFIAADRLASRSVKYEDNRVLLISDIRSELGGNLKCVGDYMANAGYEVDKMLWPSKNSSISMGELKTLAKKMRRAKYIILEDYFHYTAYNNLQKGQEVVQLWHGAGAFKKFGYSRLSSGDNIKIHQGYKKYTKVITSAEKINWCYSEAFGVPFGNVKATGIPDTDRLLDSAWVREACKAFRKAFNVPDDKKVILFAPTYRAASQRNAAYDLEKIDFDAMEEMLGDEYILAIKLHPAVYENMKEDIDSGRVYYLKDHPDFIIDISGHRDINDILPAADILVTDFSSVIFDYYLLHKPIVFFTDDEDSYNESRGLYYDYDKYTYGSVVSDMDKLIQAIKTGDMKEEMREEFGSMFMSSCDGNSTERVCRWLMEQD